MVYGTPFRTWQPGSARVLLHRLQQFVLPLRCIACGGPCTATHSTAVMDLCHTCLGLLPVNQLACRRCALPLLGTNAELECGACLRRPPPYQRAFCAFEYAYPLEHLVQRFKYGGGLAHGRVLGTLLADHLLQQRDSPWPECFIPVPLHPRRFRKRGYNQSIELGRHLERLLPVPMHTHLLMRTRDTVEQVGLSRSERRKNLRTAFTTATATLPKHVALLDDVITTGSTVREIARTLRKAGVEQIEVWGVARARLGG